MTLNIVRKFDSEFNSDREVAVFNYNDAAIDYVLGHKYFNATQMAQSVGKETRVWLRKYDTAEDIYELALELGKIDNTESSKYVEKNNDISGKKLDRMPHTVDFYTLTPTEKVKYVTDNNYWGLVKIKKGGSGKNVIQGTFIHEDLAVGLARWCSPQFRRQVDKWIKELMTQGTVKLNDKQYQSFLRYQKAVEGFPAAIENECDLSYRIKLLADLCLYRSGLEIECPLRNIINKATSWRRIDFIKKNPRNVVIYELKNHKITLRDVSDTIAEKAYMELCKRTFNKPIKLIFLSPLGIADNAEYLIQQMPNVSYQSTQDFCKDLYIKGINTKWEINRNYINELVMSDKFVNLFNVDFIDTLSTVGKSKYIKAA